jgi:hypothetical protein
MLMKVLHCLCLAVTVGGTSTAVSSAAPIINWSTDDVLSNVDPNDVLTGAATNSPVMGDGTAESADGHAIWAPLPGGTVTIADGQSLILTGSMEVEGVIAGGERIAVRFGLMYEPDDATGDGSSGDTLGWLGYFSDNSNTGSGTSSNNGTARMWARNTSVTNFDTITWASVNGGLGVQVAEDATLTPGEQFIDGTFNFSMTVSRSGDSLVVSSSLVGTGSTVFNDSMTSSVISDPNQLTFSFNRVPIWAVQGADMDRVSFSDIQMSVVPEPSTTVLVFIGCIGLAYSQRKYRC